MYYPENLSDAELRQHIGELREKYMTTDANLQNLKAISRRALVCFETLKKEYAESQQSLKAERLSHASTKRALERVEAEVRKLKLNTAEAFEEFGELQAKLEIEADLRTHAEELAAQVVTKNKKLRSAGRSLIALNPEMAKEASVKAGEDFAALTEDTEEPEEVSTKLDELAEQVKVLSKELKETRLRYTETVQELDNAKQKLAEQRPAGITAEEEQHIRKVSQMAYDEYSKLQKELEKERETRENAENVAAQAYSENKSLRRKSQVLMSASAQNERVVKLQNEVESISKELEMEKITHKRKVSELNQKISNLKQKSRHVAQIRELEEKLSAALKEAELLKTRAESNEKRAHAAELYSEKLKKENDALHTAAAGSATIPSDAAVPAVPTAAAPPPPPPPLGPPPPPLPTFKPISEIIKKTKKEPKKKKEALKDPRADAMAEMMARIKSGNLQLKHSDAKKSEEETGNSAMQQLAATLKLRKTSADPYKKPSSSAASTVTDELALKLKRRQQRAGEDQIDYGGEEVFVTPPASPVSEDHQLSFLSSLSPLCVSDSTDFELPPQSELEERLYDDIILATVPATNTEVEEVYYETTDEIALAQADIKSTEPEERTYAVLEECETEDESLIPTQSADSGNEEEVEDKREEDEGVHVGNEGVENEEVDSDPVEIIYEEMP